MARDNFTVEQKTPWLHAENAAQLYFDPANIDFSHNRCNVKAARKPTAKPVTHGTYIGYCHYGCRCASCLEAWRAYRRSIYDPKKRRRKYRRTGT